MVSVRFAQQPLGVGAGYLRILDPCLIHVFHIAGGALL